MLKIDPSKVASLKTKATDQRTKIGRFGKAGVRNTASLARIVMLPRRVATDYEDTDYFGGKLRPIQLQALHEIHDCRGGFVMARVGAGKFLVSALTPSLFPECKRPLLLVPSSLRDHTKRLLNAHRSQGWRIRADIEVRGSSELSLEHNAALLDKLGPDLIIADEVHEYKNARTSARAMRLARYMKAHPGTIFVGLTGTPMATSVREIAHLLDWALGEGSPLPTGPVLFEWAKATDRDEIMPLGAGALTKLCGPGEDVSAAVQRRIRETPGVVATDGQFLGSRLELRPWEPPTVPAVTKALQTLHAVWERPDGVELMSPLQVAMADRCLRQGFYWQEIDPAPEAWSEARREWSRWCLYVITKLRQNLDSELQIRKAVLAGEFDRPGIREACEQWEEIKNTHKPRTRPVWITYDIVDAAAQRAHDTGALVWTHSRYEAIGTELEKRGIPYYGQKGLDKHGKFCEDASGPICLSVKANCTGRNLQHKWNHNLILSLTPNAEQIEQLLGRTHRDGQPEDRVVAEILTSEKTWSKLLTNAEWIKLEQKVLIGDKVGCLYR